MVQNNNQPRAISPEEVLQAQHPMTQQELQRTQVLNIDEVEKAVRYERISSKKPAIAVAVLGILLLAFGTTFQITDNLKANKKVEKRDIAEEVTKKEIVPTIATSSLNCNQTLLNNQDGTDTIYTIKYDFEDNKLVGFTKSFTITPTVGNPLGATTVQNYTRDYQPFINPIEGYQISVVPNAGTLLVTVIVNFKKLDLTLLNPIQQTHFSTKIDYPLDTTKEVIQTEMINNGFVCE